MQLVFLNSVFKKRLNRSFNNVSTTSARAIQTIFYCGLNNKTLIQPTIPRVLSVLIMVMTSCFPVYFYYRSKAKATSLAVPLFSNSLLESAELIFSGIGRQEYRFSSLSLFCALNKPKVRQPLVE